MRSSGLAGLDNNAQLLLATSDDGIHYITLHSGASDNTYNTLEDMTGHCMTLQDFAYDMTQSVYLTYDIYHIIYGIIHLSYDVIRYVHDDGMDNGINIAKVSSFDNSMNNQISGVEIELLQRAKS